MAHKPKRWWQQILVRLPEALLDLLFPPRCLVCGRQEPKTPDGLRICQNCQDKLFSSYGQTCPCCGAVLDAWMDEEASCPFVSECLAVWMA